MAPSTTDRIEKQIVLKATPARVWRALADAREFGSWFGVHVEGTFAPGARVGGHILHKGYEHVQFDVTIEAMEPERLFAFRWHPGDTDPTVDVSGEPTTLIEFTLEAVEAGTRLTVVESGFDGIPVSRRFKAFESNSKGWAMQMEAIRKHLEGAA